MTAKTIHALKITNYKSIDSLELKELSPCAVFAGPNGSGKSNFFDALEFVSLFLKSGIETALRLHGGFANFHSEKRRAHGPRKFSFEIDCDLAAEPNKENIITTDRYRYGLFIHDIDQTPKIEEYVWINNKLWLERKPGKNPIIIQEHEGHPTERFPPTYSALLLFFDLPVAELLRNIGLYRIDPIGAKEPDQSDSDPSKLDKKSHNLASVLRRLEYDEGKRETVMAWMEAIVPGLEKITTEQQQLDGKTALLFKESGTRRRFPAHLVSDGTIYALSLLVAVLDQPEHYALTLIEEPERGLHPTPMRELMGLIREQASANHPIWLTTHSESIVRELKLNELVLVNKEKGRTKMKVADSGRLSITDIAPLGLDEAWLSNLPDGGTL